MLISLSNVLNLLQNGHFPIFSLFWQPIFFTIATVKIESIPDFYTWAVVLINNKKKLVIFFFIFWPHRGAKIAS